MEGGGREGGEGGGKRRRERERDNLHQSTANTCYSS